MNPDISYNCPSVNSFFEKVDSFSMSGERKQSQTERLSSASEEIKAKTAPISLSARCSGASREEEERNRLCICEYADGV